MIAPSLTVKLFGIFYMCYNCIIHLNEDDVNIPQNTVICKLSEISTAEEFHDRLGKFVSSEDQTTFIVVSLIC